jgi:hypothetical protein
MTLNHRTRSFSGLNGISMVLLILASVLTHAQQPQEFAQPVIRDPDYVEKADRDYVALSAALNEFRSVRLILKRVGGNNPNTTAQDFFPLTAQTYGMSFTWGTYITEMFRTEIRYGTGIRDDSFRGALDVNINYWLNWYIGATYPVTEYASVYAQYGLSHYEADVTRRQIRIKEAGDADGNLGYVTLEPDKKTIHPGLFETSFSTSWLLGLDLHLFDTTYLAMEYGRLLRDTETNIKVYQANLQLRYEF